MNPIAEAPLLDRNPLVESEPKGVVEAPLINPEALQRGRARDDLVRHFIDNSPDPLDSRMRMRASEAIAQYTGESPSQVFRNFDTYVRSIYGRDMANPETLMEDLGRALRSSFISSEMSEIHRRRRDGLHTDADLLRLEQLREMQSKIHISTEGGFITQSLRDLMNFGPSLVKGSRDSMLGGMAGAGIGALIAIALAKTAPVSVPVIMMGQIMSQKAAYMAAGKFAGSVAGSFASYQRRASGGIYGMQEEVFKQLYEEWESRPENMRGKKPVWNEREAYWTSEIFGSLAAASSSLRLHTVPGLGNLLTQIGTQSAANLAAATTANRGAGVVMGRFLGRYAEAAAAQGLTEFFQSGFETAGGLWVHESVRIGKEVGLPGNYLQQVFSQAAAGAASAARASLVNPLTWFGLAGRARAEGQYVRGSIEGNKIAQKLSGIDADTNTQALSAVDEIIAETKDVKMRSRLQEIRDNIAQEGGLAADDIKVEIGENGVVKAEARGKPAVTLKFENAGGDQIVDMVITDFKVHNKKDAAIALQQAVRAIQNDSKQTRISTDLNEKQQEAFDKALYSLSEPHRIAHAVVEIQRETVEEARNNLRILESELEAVQKMQEEEGAGDVVGKSADVESARSELVVAEMSLNEAEARLKSMSAPDLRLLHEINQDALRNDIQVEIQGRGVWALNPNDTKHEKLLGALREHFPNVTDTHEKAFIQILEARAIALGYDTVEQYVSDRYAAGMFYRADETLDLTGARGAMMELNGLVEGIIILSQDSDISTLVHELTHGFFNELSEADQRLVMEAAKEKIGDERWNKMDAMARYEAASELFSETVEMRLRTGDAPGPLQNLVEKFVEMMKAIYGALRGSFEVDPRVKDVMERMFTPGETEARPFDTSYLGLSAQAMLYQGAWHGTPHMFTAEAGFPHGRFRLDKIGTGEGAQAYGWGIYLAEEVGVAETYKDTSFHGSGERLVDQLLSAGINLSPDIIGDTYLAARALHDTIGSAYAAVGPDAREIAAYLRGLTREFSLLSSLNDLVNPMEVVADALEQFDDMGGKFLPPQEGSLYQIDIPDADVPYLLDYDLNLSEQTQAVQGILKSAGIYDDISGEDLYYSLSRELGGDKEASEYLASIGIPGLQFLDRDSRGKIGAQPDSFEIISAEEYYKRKGEDARGRPMNRTFVVRAGTADGGDFVDNPVVGFRGDRAESEMQKAIRAQEEWLKTTHNYVIWDQNLLDQIALLERNGEALQSMAEANEARKKIAEEMKRSPMMFQMKYHGDAGMNAFWVHSKKNVIEPVDRTHVQAIIADPEKYGFSEQSVRQIYEEFEEELGSEGGDAFEEVIVKVLERDWIRVRRYVDQPVASRNGTVLFTVRDFDAQQSDIDNFLLDALEIGEIPIHDYTPIAIHDLKTGRQLRWDRERGGVQSFLQRDGGAFFQTVTNQEMVMAPESYNDPAKFPGAIPESPSARLGSMVFQPAPVKNALLEVDEEGLPTVMGADIEGAFNGVRSFIYTELRYLTDLIDPSTKWYEPEEGSSLIGYARKFFEPEGIAKLREAFESRTEPPSWYEGFGLSKAIKESGVREKVAGMTGTVSPAEMADMIGGEDHTRGKAKRMIEGAAKVAGNIKQIDVALMPDLFAKMEEADFQAWKLIKKEFDTAKMADEALKAGKKLKESWGEEFLSGNRKTGDFSWDFALATCMPTARCDVCYAGAGAPQILSLSLARVRHSLVAAMFPEAVGKAIAVKVKSMDKKRLPLLRVNGAGDTTFDWQIKAINAMIADLDRPVHIFSRSHVARSEGSASLADISNGWYDVNDPENGVVVYKMGSIDNQLVDEYGIEFLKNNLRDRGIINSYLVGRPEDAKIVKQLREAGVFVILHVHATKEIIKALDDEVLLATSDQNSILVTPACPCALESGPFFNGCATCLVSEGPCFAWGSQIAMTPDGRLIPYSSIISGEYEGDDTLIPMSSIGLPSGTGKFELDQAVAAKAYRMAVKDLKSKITNAKKKKQNIVMTNPRSRETLMSIPADEEGVETAEKLAEDWEGFAQRLENLDEEAIKIDRAMIDGIEAMNRAVERVRKVERPFFQPRVQKTPALIETKRAQADRAAHQADVRQAIDEGHYVRNSILGEYKSEEWAQEEIKRRQEEARIMAEGEMDESLNPSFWAALNAKDVFEFYDIVQPIQDIDEEGEATTRPDPDRTVQDVLDSEWYDYYHLVNRMTEKEGNALFLRMLRDRDYLMQVLSETEEGFMSKNLDSAEVEVLREALTLVSEGREIPQELVSQIVSAIRKNTTEFRRAHALSIGDPKELRRLAREQFNSDGDHTVYADASVDVPFLRELFGLNDATIQLLREYGVDMHTLTSAKISEIVEKEQERLDEIQAQLLEASSDMDAGENAKGYRQAMSQVRKLTAALSSVEERNSAEADKIREKLDGARNEAAKHMDALKSAQEEARANADAREQAVRARMLPIIERKNEQIQRMKDLAKLRKARDKVARAIFAPPQKSMKSEFQGILRAVQNGARPLKKNEPTRAKDQQVWRDRDAILSKYGEDMATFLSDYEPEWLREHLWNGKYRNLTVDQLAELAEYTAQLRDAGKFVKQSVQDRIRARKAMFVKTVRDSILSGRDMEFDSTPYATGEGTGAMAKAWAQAYNAQRLLDKMDGYKGFQGDAYKLMWNGFMDAESNALRMEQKYADGFAQSMKDLGISEKDLARRITVKAAVDLRDFEYGDTDLADWAEEHDIRDTQKTQVYDYSAAEVLGLYMAMKDQNTAETAIFGDRIPPKVVDMLVDQLDDRFIQLAESRIAKDFAELWPLLRDHAVDLYDIAVPGVENYMPIHLRGRTFNDLSEQLAIEAGQRAGLVRTKTEQGMMKERSRMKPEHRRKMELDIVKLYHTHMKHASRFLHMEVQAQNMNAVFNDLDTRAAAKQMGKMKYLEELKDWSDAAIRGFATAEHNIFKTWRRRSTIGALAGRAPIILRQPVSFLYYVAAAGPHVFEAMKEGVANPAELVRKVYELDPHMRERSVDRDAVMKASQNDKGVIAALEKIGEKGMAGIAAFDKGAVVLGWYSVYLHGLSKGLSQAEAIRAARNVTLRTQPVGNIASLPGFLRGDSVISLFTQFSSQLSAIFGMITHDTYSYAKSGDPATAGVMVASLVLGQYLIWALKNGKMAPEDEEDVARMIAEFAIAPIPIVGPMVTSAMSGFNSQVPAFGWVENSVSAARGFAKVMSGEASESDFRRTAQDILRAMGPLTGAPTSAARQYWRAAESDKPLKMIILGTE